jgi:pimeloyl-ACP methyl ester carboxylesterase
VSPQLETNGISLYYETHGNSPHKLLMIVGRNGQVTDWHSDLIAELVERNFEVICFDNRDAGLSTHFDDVEVPNLVKVWQGQQDAPYSLADMACDAAGLVKALCPDGAVVVGISLGSMIAQQLTIDFPDLVRGLVLISGSTGAAGVGMPAEDVMQSIIASSGAPVTNDSALERGIKSSSRWTSWELGATQEDLELRIRTRVNRRTDVAGMTRQMAAVFSAADRTEALGAVRVPVWVLHGADDPLVDVSGGRATAAAIPDAQLLVVENLRHDLPRAVWPQLIEMIEEVRRRSTD